MYDNADRFMKDYLPVLQSKVLGTSYMKDDRFNLRGIRNLRCVSLLTGEPSVNRTLTRFSLGGTDLGFPCLAEGKTWFFFGDCHDQHVYESWHAHQGMAWTSDTDYTKPIHLEGMHLDSAGKAGCLIPPLREEGYTEAANIPTGAICLNKCFYVFYMSVRDWAGGDDWKCGFGGLMKSADGGATWRDLTGVRMPYTHFAQCFPIEQDGYVYLFGTGSGRNYPVYLARVRPEEIENPNAYTYLTGYGENGDPVFEKYALEHALPLTQNGGEISVVYNPYLDEWLMAHTNGMSLHTAKAIYGPYSDPMTMLTHADFHNPYSVLFHPAWQSESGRKIGFLMSMYWPFYNVGVFECELIKKE